VITARVHDQFGTMPELFFCEDDGRRHRGVVEESFELRKPLAD
jgi:hypothetical protein